MLLASTLLCLCCACAVPIDTANALPLSDWASCSSKSDLQALLLFMLLLPLPLYACTTPQSALYCSHSAEPPLRACLLSCRWGMFIFCSGGLQGAQLASVVSPVCVMLLLRYVSGIPTQEKQAAARWGTTQEYQDYAARTNLLVPLPKCWSSKAS